MRGLLLDVNANKVEIVNANGLDDYYKLIGCDCIDIVERGIKGKRFDIICDDEGAMTSEPKISAITDLGEPMLCGNLIICGLPDEEGSETDLSDDDIEHIKANINLMGTRKYPKGYQMLCQVEW